MAYLVLDDFSGLTDNSVTADWKVAYSKNLAFMPEYTGFTPEGLSSADLNTRLVTDGLVWSGYGTPSALFNASTAGGYGYSNYPASGIWMSFDFGENEKRVIRRFRFWHTANNDTSQDQWIKEFCLSASNDGINWDLVLPRNKTPYQQPFSPEGPSACGGYYQSSSANYPTTGPITGTLEAFKNNNPYRHYKLHIFNGYGSDRGFSPYYGGGAREMQIFEAGFDVFAERTITSYNSSITSAASMKIHSASGEVSGTAALCNVGMQIVKTIDSTDLTNYNSITFDIQASESGQPYSFGIYDAGGVSSTKNFTISEANTWNKIWIDLQDIPTKNAVTNLMLYGNSPNSITAYLANIIATTDSQNPTLSETAIYLHDRNRSRFRTLAYSMSG